MHWNAFAPLVDAAKAAAASITGLITNAVSGGADAAGGAAGAAGGAAGSGGSGASGAAGSASSGITGIISAVTGIVTAIASIGSLLVQAGMANDLGEQGRTLIKIENYLGSRGDGGIVGATLKSAEYLSYLHTDTQKSLVPDLQFVKGDTAQMRLDLGKISGFTEWTLKGTDDIKGDAEDIRLELIKHTTAFTNMQTALDRGKAMADALLGTGLKITGELVLPNLGQQMDNLIRARLDAVGATK
jgi:hypothetical protein